MYNEKFNIIFSEYEKIVTDCAVIMLIEIITNALTSKEELPEETYDKCMDSFNVLADVHRKLQ